MSYINESVNGDLNVRNKIVAGGTIVSRGAEIHGDIKVGGCVRAPFVSSANMGLFQTESALLAAHPSPAVGMYACVGYAFPAELWVCVEKGSWTDSGNVVAADAPTAQVEQLMHEAAEALVLDERLRAENEEIILANQIAKEVKNREWGEAHLKDMCRRLATMIMSNGKDGCCCGCKTDPDWLWKELILGINMDTTTDVLTIGGVEYKLKRLHPEALAVPTITITDVTTDKGKGGYDPDVYTSLKGVTGAVYRVDIAQEDGDNIKYKLYKTDETEPSSYTEYNSGAIIIKAAGTYVVKAVAYDDESESEIVTSSEFTITPVVYTASASLAYAKASSSATSLSPTFSYSAIKTDGTKISTGATSVNFDLTNAASGVTIDSANGVLSFGAYSGTSADRQLGTVTATVVISGITVASNTAIVMQAKQTLSNRYATSKLATATAPTSAAEITSPDESIYSTSGTFSSGDIIDCSSTTTRFHVAFFAVPSGKTLTIKGVISGDNLTPTPTTVDGYKLYYVNYDSSWMQDQISLTIS